jgi:hypothetical protein
MFKNTFSPEHFSQESAKNSIKALGIMITPDLCWSNHLGYAINKSKHILPRLKFLKKFLDNEDLLRLVTSQFMLIIFYASPVWISNLTFKDWKHLNSTHYAALRIVIGDYMKTMSRADIDHQTKRATPSEWARYSITSTVIKLYNESETTITKLLRSTAYVNDRLPRRAKFIDKSRLKIGRQTILHRIGPLFASLTFDWIGMPCRDSLRRKLKKQFFKYFE